MKLALAIAALALSTSAHAMTIATLPNKAGGEIALTDERCEGTPGTAIAFSRLPTGETMTGCWSKSSAYILVKWENGKLYTYPSAEFTLSDDAMKKMKEGK